MSTGTVNAKTNLFAGLKWASAEWCIASGTFATCFNPANKLVFALTVPVDNGVCSSNAKAYIEALTKSYDVTGATFVELVETSNLGLTPEAAGTVTQLRAFATCYQEIVEAVMQNKQLPEVLDSVLQPHVEFYKKNLKGGVVAPGRMGSFCISYFLVIRKT